MFIAVWYHLAVAAFHALPHAACRAAPGGSRSAERYEAAADDVAADETVLAAIEIPV
jgi:hypothetical protein